MMGITWALHPASKNVWLRTTLQRLGYNVVDCDQHFAEDWIKSSTVEHQISECQAQIVDHKTDQEIIDFTSFMTELDAN